MDLHLNSDEAKKFLLERVAVTNQNERHPEEKTSFLPVLLCRSAPVERCAQRTDMKRKILILTDKPDRARGSHHLADLLTATRERPLSPGVYTVLVKHDAWCTLLKNRGPRNCQPDIEMREVQQ